MAKKSPSSPVKRPRTKVATAPSLIDWENPESNQHILDWRARAHDFGLIPVDQADTSEMPLVQPADQLLHEEEPEAFEEQPVEAHRGAQPFGEEEEEQPEAPPDAAVVSEDIDLVRVYLRHIGKRKLLKAKDEQEIGLRIEQARGGLLAALGTIPGARRTFLALADEVKAGRAPAAELILLPDGGELKPDKVEPVMKAIAKVRRLEKQIEELRERCMDRRSTSATRASYTREISNVEDDIGRVLGDLPIRPSVVDDVVVELTHIDNEFRALERQQKLSEGGARHASPEHKAAIEALETRAGMTRKTFAKPKSGCSMRSASCSRRTCAW
jgi:hypothetical protein